jgi:hypothetical protein
MPSSDGKNTPRTGNGVASGNRRRRSPRLLARTVAKAIVSALLEPISELDKRTKTTHPDQPRRSAEPSIMLAAVPMTITMPVSRLERRRCRSGWS